MSFNTLVIISNFTSTAGILFCGAVGLLMLLMLLILSKNREKIYFHYAFFLLFMLFYGIIHMLSTAYGEPSDRLVYVSKRLIEPVTILSFVFYILFSLELIEIKKQRPSLHKALLYFAFLGITYSLLYFTFYAYIEPFRQLIFIGARMVIFPFSIFFLLRIHFSINSPLKNYFMMGSYAYFLGSIIATFRFTLSDIPFPLLYKISSPIYFEMGILVEISCFALALSHRIHLLHTEKEQASQQLIHQLSINEQMARRLNMQLEEQVKERTKEIRITQTKLYNQEKERLQAEFEKRLAQSEMLARRLQINPHFIFNCLNSIKYLIQSGQNNKASQDLVTFSKFFRMVLDSSQKPEISLQEEMEVVAYYLKLEQKRFSNEFSYVIEGAENPNLKDILIPPLLLQPFAENAIWHGLLNSSQKTKVIKISIQEYEEQITVHIDDNGIGRKEGNKLSIKKLNPSNGIPLTYERVMLYNQNHENSLSFSILDKVGKNDLPLGTRVELHIKKPSNESILNS